VECHLVNYLVVLSQVLNYRGKLSLVFEERDFGVLARRFGIVVGLE
jgi:hypothetical protein